MPRSLNARDRAGRALAKLLNKPFPARVGWIRSLSPLDVRYRVPGRPNHLYITLGGTINEALNRANVPHGVDWPVLVVEEPIGLVIVGVDKSRSDALVNVPDSEYGVTLHPLGTHTDVDLASPSDGAVVRWDNTAARWIDDVLDPDDLDDAATTNKFTTQAEIDKLAGIAAGAEVNVNADWDAGSGDAQILNKPTLDEISAPVASVSLNSQKITNLLDPTAAQDAATKAYVDAVASGLDVKASVRVATTANITLSGTQTIDGVAVVVGDRVLVKNQSTPSQNGIYVVAAGAWARASDADANAEVTSGLFTFVTEGTVSGNTGWALTTDDPITVGSTALTFSQFSGPTNIAASISGASTDDDITDASLWGYVKAGILVKTAWSNIKSVLTTFFDTLFVRQDGTKILTGNWDLGEDRYILSEKMSARDAEGFTLTDDAGNPAIYVVDGGTQLGIFTTDIETVGAGFKALQLGNEGYLLIGDAGSLQFTQNAYWDGVSWKRRTADVACYVNMSSGGQFHFYVAPTGTIDSAITWVEASRIDQSAVLHIAQVIQALTSSGLAFKTDDGITRATITDFGTVFLGTLGAAINDANVPLQLSNGADNTEANFGINFNGAYNFLFGARKQKAFSGVNGGAAMDAVYLRMVRTDPLFIMVNNTVVSTAWLSNGDVGIGGTITSTTTLAGAVIRILSGKAGIGVTPTTILGIQAGSSNNDAAVGGILYKTTTPTGNVGTGEDTIASYTVPANTLSSNNMSLKFKAWGTKVGIAEPGTFPIRLKWGTETIVTLTASGASAGEWFMQGEIIRSGATSQKVEMFYGAGFISHTSNNGLSRTLSSANDLAITAEGTNNNDVVCEAFIVEWDDANT